MMRVTIIPSDGFVSVDGVGYSGLDLSSIPSNVHAVQWYGNKGEVEFVVDDNGVKAANQEITSIAAYQSAVTVWDAKDYAEKNQPAPPPPAPATAEQNKETAKRLLEESDWSQLGDVSTTLQNKAAFDAYRAELRSIVLDPVAGDLVWPVRPEAVWA